LIFFPAAPAFDVELKLTLLLLNQDPEGR
jgi:hypothetical protein